MIHTMIFLTVILIVQQGFPLHMNLAIASSGPLNARGSGGNSGARALTDQNRRLMEVCLHSLS